MLRMVFDFDVLFKTLGDPTRRAIFEQLCREGEQTVSALTARGRGLAARCVEASWRSETSRYGARPTGRTPNPLQRLHSRFGPADRLDEPNDRILAKPLRCSWRFAWKDGPVNEQIAETRCVVI